MEFAASSRAPIVYVLDDEAAVRISLVMLLTASAFRAQPFASTDDLLNALPYLEPGCFVMDVRLPGRSGIDALAALREQDCHWPVIIMTGHGDISVAVRAMKLAASDFLEKPFSDARLQGALTDAFAGLHEAVRRSEQARNARLVLSRLSARERQVFDGVISGRTSKEIAIKYGLSHRTVEAYRSQMMLKLQVENSGDLFQLVPHVNWNTH